jgi:plastocyanin
MKSLRHVAVLSATVLIVAGCGSSDEAGTDGATEPAATSATSAAEPSPSAAPVEEDGVVVDVAIEGGKATPQGERVDVAVGQEITLTVASDAEEEIHVHSDPEHTWQVAAGESISETFTIDTPGQVAVEAHHLGVTIVQLVVRP